MRNLVYLLVALGVIGLGMLVMALRAREPKGFDSGIRAHQRHMDALSTEARRDSTGIDRIQPMRRVDPLTPGVDPADADDLVDEDAEPPGAPGVEG
jgi:hypothetical protein